jgi:uncharacterized protein (TIGR02145 family)
MKYFCKFLLVAAFPLAIGCSKDDSSISTTDGSAGKITDPVVNFIGPVVTDKDGRSYNSIVIQWKDDNLQLNSQTWMSQNLSTTTYNDGTPIPLVTDDNAWVSLTSPAYCYHGNNSSNKYLYGALYNWYTVKTGKLCPVGWHVPSDDEFTKLAYFVGGPGEAGGKLKERDTIHWMAKNPGATNSIGFTALPAGYRSINLKQGFNGFLGITYFWSTTETYENRAISFGMWYQDSGTDHIGWQKQYGFSVRCIKDWSTS